ncbi:MAG TPA: hypothetical protein VKN76_03335, partial [Kiloniellaceae bacterium]|nr:hypothetical protein [Kiloniellaceae bacterium]
MMSEQSESRANGAFKKASTATYRVSKRSAGNRRAKPATARVASSLTKVAAMDAPANNGGQTSLGETPLEEWRAEDLLSPELYLNRELTWLNFNLRVLHEAQDERNPLLERVKFLAIANSNLDEFFMKRLGGLKQQLATGVHQRTVDGRTPQEQIIACTNAVRGMQASIENVYKGLVRSLAQNDIVIASFDQLSEKQREKARDQFQTNIFPLVTPLAMDPAHPFPFISNLSLNLLVSLHYQDEEELMLNRIKVPIGSGIPRFLKIEGENCFVPLEGVIANNLDLLFPDMKVASCEFFRVTRNANTELDEDHAEDLLSMIEAELRYRKFAPFVRLETDSKMAKIHRGMLAAELGLDEGNDVFEMGSILGMRDLMEIATLDAPELHDPDHHPITSPKLQETRNIFHLIRESGSILLQHPYESFATSIERFVREASRDPKVVAIKMTLYRTSADTEILEYLIEAAQNGK